MWTRAGDRTILVNDPDGFPSGTPVIPQPTAGGWSNPGYTWLGSDNPAWFRTPNAAGLPSVSRALGLIADSIASMPWAVYRDRVRLPEPVWVRDPQNAQQDRRIMQAAGMPDPTPVVAWRSQMLASLVMHGEAFLYARNRDEMGYPKPPVYLLNPVEVDSVMDGQRATGMFKVGQDVIPPQFLLHVLGRAPYTVEGRGQGVLTRHLDALNMAATVRSSVTSAYGAGVPAGYLKVTQPGLNQEQANALKSAWMTAHGGNRGIAVLNATTEFTPISWSLADLSAIEMGAFTDREVAHAFGMSAHYLDVVGDSSTYANVQDRAIDFRTFTLLPWCRLVESAMETWLPVGTTMKIRLEGLERANVTTRDTSYVTRLAAGIMTIDEVRDLEDLEPLPAQSAPAEPSPLEATDE